MIRKFSVTISKPTDPGTSQTREITLEADNAADAIDWFWAQVRAHALSFEVPKEQLRVRPPTPSASDECGECHADLQKEVHNMSCSRTKEARTFSVTRTSASEPFSAKEMAEAEREADQIRAELGLTEDRTSEAQAFRNRHIRCSQGAFDDGMGKIYKHASDCEYPNEHTQQRPNEATPVTMPLEAHQKLVRERDESIALRIHMWACKRCTFCPEHIGQVKPLQPRTDYPRPGAIDTAWPARDVVQRLADFANDRLTVHGYDGHGWEELQRCRDVAYAWLREAQRPETAKTAWKCDHPTSEVSPDGKSCLACTREDGSDEHVSLSIGMAEAINYVLGNFEDDGHEGRLLGPLRKSVEAFEAFLVRDESSQTGSDEPR